jgi:hypothetical protein
MGAMVTRFFRVIPPTTMEEKTWGYIIVHSSFAL